MATWSVVATHWPSQNPAVGGPPYFPPVVQRYDGMTSQAFAETVRDQLLNGTGLGIEGMVVPGVSYGAAWAYIVHTG